MLYANVTAAAVRSELKWRRQASEEAVVSCCWWPWPWRRPWPWPLSPLVRSQSNAIVSQDRCRTFVTLRVGELQFAAYSLQTIRHVEISYIHCVSKKTLDFLS